MTELPQGTADVTGCDEILVANDGPVRIVTLNNPGNANAWICLWRAEGTNP